MMPLLTIANTLLESNEKNNQEIIGSSGTRNLAQQSLLVYCLQHSTPELSFTYYDNRKSRNKPLYSAKLTVTNDTIIHWAFIEQEIARKTLLDRLSDLPDVEFAKNLFRQITYNQHKQHDTSKNHKHYQIHTLSQDETVITLRHLFI